MATLSLGGETPSTLACEGHTSEMQSTATDDPPTRDELVNQAERVLSMTKATMYGPAAGEAYRLEKMLREADDTYESVGGGE